MHGRMLMTARGQFRLMGVPFFLLSVFALPLVAGFYRAEDWANWRGPEQTGVSRERRPT